MIVGKLVEAACLGLKQTLLSSGFLSNRTPPTTSRAPPRSNRAFAPSRIQRIQSAPGSCGTTKSIKAMLRAFAWAVYVASVTVDPDIRSYVEISSRCRKSASNSSVLATDRSRRRRASHRIRVVRERSLERSRMMNAQMTNYIMPTSADLPPIRVFRRNP